jgi:hypothetical protein
MDKHVINDYSKMKRLLGEKKVADVLRRNWYGRSIYKVSSAINRSGNKYIGYLNTAYVVFFRHKKAPQYMWGLSDPDWIRTNDPQLRRLMLYPAELPDQLFLLFVIRIGFELMTLSFTAFD